VWGPGGGRVGVWALGPACARGGGGGGPPKQVKGRQTVGNSPNDSKFIQVYFYSLRTSRRVLLMWV
jgi:hypothetical protein